MKDELLAAFARVLARSRDSRRRADRSRAAASRRGRTCRATAPDDAPDLVDGLRHRYNPLILAMRRLEKPIIGAINGVAAGAGLLARARLRPAHLPPTAPRSCRVRAGGPRPDSGPSWFLPRLVGPAVAADLALLGDPLPAAEAERRGLVSRVVPAADLARETRTLAIRLAAGAPRALALTKDALNRSFEASLEEQLEREAALQGIAGRTADHREGVAAFLEKRPPRFTGE